MAQQNKALATTADRHGRRKIKPIPASCPLTSTWPKEGT